MKDLRSAPWYRHILPILAVTVLSFVLSQAPLALSPRPLSLGNEGEGPFHIAVEMKLRDPTLFSKDVGLNMLVVPSRPLTDRLIHRAVIYIGDAIFGGDLIVANIALFWLYHVLFIAGCYFLGLHVLRCTWGGVLFAAASTMPSQALFEGWGMVYGGGVIPHVLILTIVPWFILGFLKSADHPCRMAVLFALLGLSANVYALVPLHLFVVLFVVAIVGKPAKWLLVWALAFGIMASPAIYAAALLIPTRFAELSPQEQALAHMLVVRHYGYTTFQPWTVTLKGLVRSPIWLFLAIGAGAFWLKRRCGLLSGDDCRLISIAVVTLVFVVGWMVAARFVSSLVIFLLYRSSSFLYIPAYLGCLWLVFYWFRSREWLDVLSALLLLCLVLLNGIRWTVLWDTITGRKVLPTSPAFYQLCDWASTTPRDSLFMIPETGYHFFAFRVYAGRAVTVHYVLGETAISVPGNVQLYWDMINDVGRAYELRDAVLFVQVAHRYQVDYIVDVQTAQPLNLPVAFQNGMFTVYTVPQESP